jgi:L,D-transpeptidase ErfK/SrfK
MAVKRTRALGAKAHGQNISAGCLLVLIFISLLWSSGATGQAQRPLPEQVAGGEFFYTVQKGDSLTCIGARFGVDAAVLVGNNRLSPRALLQVGEQLRVDNRHVVPTLFSDGIVINLPQRMLYFKRGG